MSKKMEGLDEVELFPKFTLVLYFANLIVQIFLYPVKGAKSPESGLPTLQLNYFPAFVQDYTLDKELLAIQDPKTSINMHYHLTFQDLRKEECEASEEVIHLTYDSEE
jgi:hypothetical protein